MSLSEANAAVAPHPLTVDAREDGYVSAHGSVQWLGQSFSANCRFAWNTGLEWLDLSFHSADRQIDCAALIGEATSDLAREFGAFDSVNGGVFDRAISEQTPWSVRILTISNAAGCWLHLWIIDRPIAALPDPMIAELAEDVPMIEGEPVWLAVPTREQVLAAYPERAKERDSEGDVDLACRVNLVGGGLRCMVIQDLPSNWGFGAAAVELAEAHYRIAPLIDGVPSAGRQLRLHIELHDPPERTCCWSQTPAPVVRRH